MELRGIALDTTIKENKVRNISINKVVSSSEALLLLNTDNNELKNLCKQAEIRPKKDTNTGKTFFLKEDVNFLKRIKNLHSKSSQIINENTALMNMTPNMPSAVELQLQEQMEGFIKNIISAQESVAERIQKTLDEKLDGMDEVVVELIRCKSENENLRNQLNSMTKENYKLKQELNSFRPIPFGFFVKDQIENYGYID